jgi:geranylgeranyl diphosphate synthase type II
VSAVAPGTDPVERGRRIVEESLLAFLDEERCAAPARLREAMAYSLGAGGKRLRPVVLLASGTAWGGSEEMLLPFACALEYVHTYSLIHDDLPAMDDDDYRRGIPTCHRAFGEATAILAGDALLTEAFRIAAEAPLSAIHPDRAIRATAILARSAGAEGMVGGQQLDLSGEGSGGGTAEVEAIHLRKTAALFEAASRMGAVLAGAGPDGEESLGRYGRALGLLFQVTDDLLDETGSFEEMGKAVAKDRARGKLTWPAAAGIAAAEERAAVLAGEALAALAPYGAEAETLRRVVRLVPSRRS